MIDVHDILTPETRSVSCHSWSLGPFAKGVVEAWKCGKVTQFAPEKIGGFGVDESARVLKFAPSHVDPKEQDMENTNHFSDEAVSLIWSSLQYTKP